MFLVSLDAWAQGMPRRERGGTREAKQHDQSPEAPKPATEPFAALERELPSLEFDLRLTAEQVEPWRLFSRDVRDIAEMDRTRLKHLSQLREMGERPPSAVSFVGAVVEDQRLKSEAMLDMQRHLELLYGKFDDSQKRTFDRRIMQSQTEPLGK
jgi:hypothetical protein